jgi:AcrR family transcriptional regulator
MQARSGRVAVLDAAVQNFQRVGYHGTSMRDIATGAGFTVASIYNHFPSKQRILQEIMVGILTDALAATRSAVLRAGALPHDQLRALMHAWLVFHTERRDEAVVGATEIRSLDPDGRRLVVALRDEQEHLFREVVEHGAETGAFGTPHPAEAVRALIAMGTSVASWYRPGGGLTPHQMGERYARLALGIVEAQTDRVTGSAVSPEPISSPAPTPSNPPAPAQGDASDD